MSRSIKFIKSIGKIISAIIAFFKVSLFSNFQLLIFDFFQIFTVVKTGEFLDSIYVPNKNLDMRDIMGRVVEDVNSCIEAGTL